jgi:type II secretory pathway pseudopilin PulG
MGSQSLAAVRCGLGLDRKRESAASRTMLSRSTVRRRRNGHPSDGYVLITLILFVALLAIAMTALAPVIVQQMKRDREEELIHRGVQYSRAIKHYVKKFGRYPTKIEDLQSTNNLRFLRKPFKDPITGKDFKILRMGDVQMSFGPGIAGATSAAALAAQSGAFNGNNGFGGRTLGGSTLSAFASTGTPGSMNANGQPASGQDDTTATPDQTQGTPGATPAAGPAQAGPAQSGQAASDNKVFGGGPIVGVASISKEKSIRIFNKKDRYYQWQFIYDPSTDRGGLLTTPNQPGLQSLAGAVQQGAPGTPGGQQNSPFGQPQGSAFGFPGGPQMNPGGMQPGSMQPGGMQPGPASQPLQQQPQFPPDQAPQ